MIRPDWSDALIGLALVTLLAGLWLMAPPVAILAGGLLLLAVGVLLGLAQARR